MSQRATTDFFQRQDDARRNTVRLIILFAIAVLVLSLGTYVALAFIINPDAMLFLLEPGQPFYFDIELGLLALLFTGAFIFLGSAFKTSSLKKGGNVVAESLGGKEVGPSASDPLVRRLVNVVEEMSLASGVPVPRIYVLENEPGINAFAAGFTMNDAAVAVTRGALEQLTRDELQGVVAHEFSHILNGDMRLNIRLIGVIHGILLMYLTGRVLLRVMFSGSRRRSSGRGGGGIIAVAAAGLVLVVFGLGGVLCGRLIKGAVSRQREYLADAAAVQFTRNPDGLAGALKKIGGFAHGSSLQASKAEEISHMCFGNVSEGGFSSLSGRWMATHPPLEKRIAAIDPSFDGTYKELSADKTRARLGSSSTKGVSGKGQAAMGLASDAGASRAAAGGGDSMVQGAAMAAAVGGNDWASDRRQLDYQMQADDVVEAVGETSPQRLVYCSTLLDEIPRPLMDARGELMGAMATVYTLLLDRDPEERRKQAQMLQKYADPGIIKESQKLWNSVGRLDREFRLPLMDLLVPTLRRMTEEQFQDFSAMVDRLIQADGKVTFEEFVLEKVVLHRLEMALHDPGRKVVQFHSFRAVASDIENLLSCIAYVGHDDLNTARISFQEGRDRLPPKVRGNVSFRSRDRWSFPQVGASLDRLSAASPTIKKAVIDACAFCVMGDGVVVVEEVEMLRAVCETLDVPLPPFIPEATRRN